MLDSFVVRLVRGDRLAGLISGEVQIVATGESRLVRNETELLEVLRVKTSSSDDSEEKEV